MIHAIIVGLVGFICFWYAWEALMLALGRTYNFVTKYKALSMLIAIALSVFCFGPTALIIRVIATIAVFGGTGYWLVKHFNNP